MKTLVYFSCANISRRISQRLSSPCTTLTWHFGTHRNWVAGFALSGTKQQGYGFNGHNNGCDDINKEILRIYFTYETAGNFWWPKMEISIFVLSLLTLMLYTQVQGQSGQSQQDELSILEIIDATAQLSEVFIWNFVSLQNTYILHKRRFQIYFFHSLPKY